MIYLFGWLIFLNIYIVLKMMSRAQGTNWNYAHLCLVTASGLRANINAGGIIHFIVQPLFYVMFELQILEFEIQINSQ